MADDIFRPNSPPVIHETVDNEVIIVNLVTGTYYQLSDVGAEIWEALIAGVPTSEIGDLIASRYGLAKGIAENDVADILRQLQEEALIVADPAVDRREPPLSGNGATDYRRPQLAKFTDMQDLLLLDPVHEVDEAGWPAAPA